MRYASTRAGASDEARGRAAGRPDDLRGKGGRGPAVMRILIVTDQYAPMVGGVPTVTRALAIGLARKKLSERD